MRGYRTAWRFLVLLVTLAAALVGIVGVGWLATIGTSVAFACLGALFGFSWIEEPGPRTRLVAQCALWFGVAGLLVIGLPPVVGPWSLPVLLVVGLSCPPLVELALGRWRVDRPATAPVDDPSRLSDRDLARRWRWTTERLDEHHVPPGTRLRLAQERGLLLDELERRDPVRFADWLARTGWHEPQER